jgi:serine/threonine-protein kinase RsbW
MDAIEMTLRAVPAAAATARREITRRLSARLAVNALEDVRLLLTELVTNALRHGKVTPEDEIGVRAEVADGTVRIEVHDPGRNGEVERRRPGARGGGYGLLLVDRLTNRWGVDRQDGTTVWVELPAGAAR